MSCNSLSTRGVADSTSELYKRFPFFSRFHPLLGLLGGLLGGVATELGLGGGLHGSLRSTDGGGAGNGDLAEIATVLGGLLGNRLVGPVNPSLSAWLAIPSLRVGCY